MLDFLIVSKRTTKNGEVVLYPKFKIYPKSTDLMIRGGDFYSVWLEDEKRWSTDESDALFAIDKQLEEYADDYEKKHGIRPKIMHMWDSESGMVDTWHKYCKKQVRDSFAMLDEKLIFSNTDVKKEDYASKRLNYPLEKGDISGYEKLISTLYSEEERMKIEWSIGAIVSGDSKHIQKFMVLYGAQGTGKSTIINIIEKLFEGYYSVFDAKALGSFSNSFALEAFNSNPLVAIQHDGDLSRIEDNTRLNSLVSHEEMSVNEKFKSTYTNRFKAFLIMGTNKPVKITDAKSGLLRRLIDVTPSGQKLSRKEYDQAVKKINFELGAIAYHCQEVYLANKNIYDDYVPSNMMGATNDFYNFIIDSYHIFVRENGTNLKAAWEMYKQYCDEARVPYPMTQRLFKEELKNYFKDFEDRVIKEDGTIIRNSYSNFKTDIFQKKEPVKHEITVVKKLELLETKSLFDEMYKDSIAQYATKYETPMKEWDKVKTTLKDLDTRKLHYVRVPLNHIVIDFDLKDADGNKSLELNLIEAAKWPSTYAEISKSGQGVHLHYLYNGDATQLSAVYDDQIEIKVFSGKQSLRRQLSYCNDIPIATISSGLPLRSDKKMIIKDVLINEKAIRRLIEKNLKKEYHADTKSSVDFIHHILEKAYNAGVKYDVSDLENIITAFAAQSTNQSLTCLKTVALMKFKSEEPSKFTSNDEKPITFYDIEVFPNLFLVNYKEMGEGKPIQRMINPSIEDIQFLVDEHRLVGFNCRRYDNHILYARLLGYDNTGLYKTSQAIINSKKGSRSGFFGEAYNISYTDIYDFSTKKQSLKKWEIELGISHVELGLPWDQPVPKEKWIEVSEYCDNDVLATEAVFNHLKADWIARQILSDISGGSVNDTTNSLTTRFIFKNDKEPQQHFQYRNLAEPVHSIPDDMREFLTKKFPKMMKPFGKAESILPYFPGYKFVNGVSTYKGFTVGEGGFVHAKPGIYGNVALIDVASMHPHSIIAEYLFGKYTKIFADIVSGRITVKHEDWKELDHLLDGKLVPYIQKIKDGEFTSGDLAMALKIAINSVYGLTSAHFSNKFRDNRNVDNIVAKRGALFMIDLLEAVEEKGYNVVHIKTDSIKIADADSDIVQFVMEFGEKYGYSFEHEATYDRMCLVNDAVYIAKYKDAENCNSMYGYIPGDNKKKGNKWVAVGKQFAVPYLFKKLFSKEDILLSDVKEVFSVKSALYLDMNEHLPDVTLEEKELDKLEKAFKKEKIEEQEYLKLKEELQTKITSGHDYKFVGKVGSFYPVKPGTGGGELRREQDGKYHAAAGTTGYRWLEADMVNDSDAWDIIDTTFYDNLVTDAIHDINQYGDFEWFVSDDPYIPRV
ncbi:DUF5906 domain-containing protein [Enterococcus cecorum]